MCCSNGGGVLRVCVRALMWLCVCLCETVFSETFLLIDK